MLHGTIKYTLSTNGVQHTFTFGGEAQTEHLSVEIRHRKTSFSDTYHIYLHIALPMQIDEAAIIAPLQIHESDNWVLNGFQSWTDTRFYDNTDKMLPPEPPVLKHFLGKFHLHAYGDYQFYKYPQKRGNLHGYTFAYRAHPDNNITLIASLTDHKAFTRIQLDYKNNNIILYPETQHHTTGTPLHLIGFVTIKADARVAFQHWAEKSECKPAVPNRTSGYTSWYSFYENTSEKKLEQVLNGFIASRILMEYFQIDDGYQTHVGDWLSLKPEFPNGLKFLVDKIHTAGYKAGLWLAPLAVHPQSKLAQQNKHWIATNADGSPIWAGSNWGGFHPLNFYLPEVRNYLKMVFEHIEKEWGFEMVKLDFLYAATMVQVPGKSRAQKMHDAMVFLREISGKMKILACGVPLASAFGLTDFCRIGPDVGLEWESLKMRITGLRERVSTKNTIQNTIARYWLNQAFLGNDPDVFLLRKLNIKMNANERFSLYLANQIFGHVLFTSDDVRNYTPEILRLYKLQFPILQPEVEYIHFQKGIYTAGIRVHNQRYFYIFNSTEKKQFHQLQHDYNVCSLPYAQFYVKGEKIELKPHQSFLLFEISENNITPAGSSLHLFGANVIQHFETNEGKAQYALQPNVVWPGDGEIWIKVSGNNSNFECNGRIYPVQFNKIYYITAN